MSTITNPWLPGNSADDGETPPWSEIFRRWVDAKAADLHVALPCVVTVVKTPNRVDLQPLLMEKYKYTPAAVPLPIIQDALVCTPRGAAWSIKLPIAPGDTGLAIFTDRSLDVFSASPGKLPVDPVDMRRHNLSDAVFVPGLYPFTNPPVNPLAGPLDMILQNGLAQLLLQPGGTFMQGNGTLETFNLLSEALTTLTTVMTGAATTITAASLEATTAGVTVVGPASPLQTALVAVAAVFSAAVTTLTAVTAGITTLTGAPGE